jgi:hypothetical protein
MRENLKSRNIKYGWMKNKDRWRNEISKFTKQTEKERRRTKLTYFDAGKLLYTC